MILFAGIPSEPPMALAIESARRMGVAHVVFNQRHAAFVDMTFDQDEGGVRGRIAIDGTTWPLEEFSGIYARLVEASVLPEHTKRAGVLPDPFAVARAAFLFELFGDWLEIAPGRIVNVQSAMASNVSKPFQSQLIQRAGFLVPPTLVTNVAADVREFHRRHSRIIFKSVSSVRSIVREWSPADGGALDRVASLPTQFQAFIPGENVRVHVAGEEVFATRITSDSVDYRYAEEDGHTTQMQPTTLPPHVMQRCRDLARGLRLPLAGIDLKVTPEDAWYCFEVNPSPAYSCFQEHSGQPISDALVRYLANIQSNAKEAHGPGNRKPRRSRREIAVDRAG
jgi:hypothetical protein